MEPVEAPAARRTSKRPIQPTQRETRETSPTCVHCRKHKLKCTGQRPQCAACVSRDGSCEYDEPTRAPSARVAAAAAAAAGTSRKRPAPTSTYAQIKESRQRKRAAAAQTSCDFCRNDLRRKCDGLRPSCQSCIKRGEPCVYSGPASIPLAAPSSTASYPRLAPSDGEESDIAIPSRSHSPDIPLANSPTTPLDLNRPRYPQGNGLGHAGSTRNPDGTNCTRPVACFFCIKVELPCTGDFPTCVNCVRRNLQCTYPDPSSYAHQFPRQSAIHTRQLKDGTPHRASASGTHTSPTRTQPTIHPSRSHPGPLNQTGPISPPPMNASASTSPNSHHRQRSLSGPNGLPPGFGAEVIRSPIDNIPRSTSGPRSSVSATSPSRPSVPAHSRTPSASGPSPGQSTLTNPIPLPSPIPRSTVQSSPPQPKTWTPSVSLGQPQPPKRWNSQADMQLDHDRTPSKMFKASDSRDYLLPRPYPPTTATAERVIGDVRAPPGDVCSPVNGVIVSPSGRTRDASLVHSKSNSGSNGPTDGFVHEGPASYRARIGEKDVNAGTATVRPITEEPGQIVELPLRNGVTVASPTSPSRPRTTDQAQGPAPTESGPILALNPASRQEDKVMEEASKAIGPQSNGTSTTIPAIPTRNGSGPTPTDRPVVIPSDARLPQLPDSLPRRPSGPSPVAQHPARDLSIIAPMARPQDPPRRDTSVRYDPRRDVGVRDERWDSGERRDSGASDRRGSTAGRDPPSNWQPAPRSNTQPRPVPLNATRRERDHSPHTPCNQAQPLPPSTRERSPPPSRKSGSGSPGVSGAGSQTPQDTRSRGGSRRRSQSPRGIHLRAESGSMRSSPMDMDSS